MPSSADHRFSDDPWAQASESAFSLNVPMEILWGDKRKASLKWTSIPINPSSGNC